MERLETPVLDNHLHLHPEGKGVAAAKEFARSGGTHLLVVNRPSWHFVEHVEDRSAFRETFERTISLVEEASEALPGRAWPVLGVHPVLLPRLVDDFDWSVDAARSLMVEGLELAATYVAEGQALALKSGRPHFPVDEAILEASNGVMQAAFSLAATHDCAVQLHTEGSEDLTPVASMAEAVGLSPTRVVKHYASGPVEGVVPSVIAKSDAIEAITAYDGPVLLETDFLDDPSRPGAVLGPKLVPRRSRELASAGHDGLLRRAHIETPKQVYGIDTVSTVS